MQQSDRVEQLLGDIKDILQTLLTQETNWIIEMHQRNIESDRKSEEDRATIMGYWKAQYDRDESLKRLREQEHELLLQQMEAEAKRVQGLQEERERWRKEDVERQERQEHLATKVYQAQIRQIYGVPQEPLDEVLP